MPRLTTAQIANFQADVWGYFTSNRRAMPWREPGASGAFDPYGILVSELMLQQTQVSRVVPKYTAFMAAFPTVKDLAKAPLAEVLRLWSGLGYNRRAKFLWQAAGHVHNECGGVFPATLEGLVKLPGVGKNTAGAIMAYAYNESVIFIETNIRSVYLHHFFADAEGVADTDLAECVAATLPAHSIAPREWYWALMDYGSYLKATHGNAARRSKHYAKQAPLKGSLREIRGKVLKLLADGPHTARQLEELITDERLEGALAALQAEGLVSRRKTTFFLG